MEQQAVEAVQKRQRLDRYAEHINNLLKYVQIDPVVNILSYLEADEMYYIMSQHPADRSFAEEHDKFWKKVALSKFGQRFKDKEEIFTGISEAGAGEAENDSLVPPGYRLNYLWMLLALWGAKKLFSRSNDPFKTNSIEFSFNNDEIIFGVGLVSPRHIDVVVKQNPNQVDLPLLFDALEGEFGADSIISFYRSWRVDLRRNLDYTRPDDERLARFIYRLMLIRDVKIAQTYCIEEKRILLRERLGSFYH